MDKEKLRQFKDSLLKLKSEITRMLETQDQPMELRDSFDSVDLATDMIGKMMGALVSSTYEKNLEKIEAALKRMEKDEFGQCLVCGSEISVARLEALPFTLYCIDCQKELEKKRELIREQTEPNFY